MYGKFKNGENLWLHMLDSLNDFDFYSCFENRSKKWHQHEVVITSKECSGLFDMQ